MSDTEQIQTMRLVLLKDIDDDSQDELFEIYLKNALAVLLNTLFPYDKEATISEDDFRLRNWQVRCAIELYGATDRSGVQSYSENGLSVSYFASLVSTSLLNELNPKAGCPIMKEVSTETPTEGTNGGEEGD
jgi:hypothetical protein